MKTKLSEKLLKRTFSKSILKNRCRKKLLQKPHVPHRKQQLKTREKTTIMKTSRIFLENTSQSRKTAGWKIFYCVAFSASLQKRATDASEADLGCLVLFLRSHIPDPRDSSNGIPTIAPKGVGPSLGRPETESWNYWASSRTVGALGICSLPVFVPLRFWKLEKF